MSERLAAITNQISKVLEHLSFLGATARRFYEFFRESGVPEVQLDTLLNFIVRRDEVYQEIHYHYLILKESPDDFSVQLAVTAYNQGKTFWYQGLDDLCEFIDGCFRKFPVVTTELSERLYTLLNYYREQKLSPRFQIKPLVI